MTTTKRSLLAAAILLSGLAANGFAQQSGAAPLTSWTHAVQAAEYRPAHGADGSEYLIYTYRDSRFSTDDWFDTWIEDWVGQTDGWSRFLPVLDQKTGRLMYDVMYHDGYVTWYAYPADLKAIVGHQLKFFRIRRR